MSNYKDWIKAIDIDVDYFSAFMKAWIAFNSWYKTEIGDGTDKQIIDEIKSNDNRFKSYINNLLTSQTTESNSFLESVANLHESLLNAAITTQEYVGVKEQISFSEIAVKNSNNLSQVKLRNCQYIVKRSRGKIMTDITNIKTSRKYLNIEQNSFDFEELTQQSDFINLSNEQKQQCKKCYLELKPYIIESVLYSGDDAKQIGIYGFVNDNNKISRAIVEILYLLRCSLAHGDISPDANSNKVYKYAYEILATALKKLL